MKLEEQVITLEQAKRLQELGMKVPCLYFWQNYKIDDGNASYFGVCGFTGLPEHFESEFFSEMWQEGILDFQSPDEWEHSRIDMGDKSFPAYTVAELGEMLPVNYLSIQDIVSEDSSMCFSAWKLNGDFRIEDLMPLNNEVFKTEAQARAAMLIHLLGNGIIQPTQTEQP